MKPVFQFFNTIKQIPCILSKTTALLVFFSILSTINHQAKWQTEDGYVINDVKGYYAYLPFAFIKNDIKFETTDQSVVWFSTDEDGKRFIKYTTGMSIIYAPSFFIADTISSIFNYPKDGYSLIYQLAFIVTALLFLLIALYVLIKFLRLFFKDHIAAIIILILFLGTNLFHYTTSYLSYSHLYSFTLTLIFLYATIRWIEKPSWKLSFILGFSASFFILIRPVDIIYLLFPLIFGINSLEALKYRLQLFARNYKFFILIVFAGFIVWIPQFIYTYSIWGEIKMNTYSQEKFFFTDPEIIKSLFSFRNGWLIYSPLMAISIVGLFYYVLQKKEWGWLIVIATYVFVISSWWYWWYEGFGNRAYINLYPFLIIPLGYGLILISKNKISSWLFSLIIPCLIYLALYQNFQFETGAFTSGKMSKEAYMNSFLKKYPSSKFYDLLIHPDIEMAAKGIDVIEKLEFDTLAIDQNLLSNPITIEKEKPSNFNLVIPRNKADRIICTVKVNELKEKEYFHIQKIDTACKLSTFCFNEVIDRVDGNDVVEVYFSVKNDVACANDSLEIFLNKNLNHHLEIKSLKVLYLKSRLVRINQE